MTNAIQAGFQPTYSIVEWTQFVLLLTVVLGFTAELPLLMGGLVYADIVPYDLFGTAGATRSSASSSSVRW